MRTGAVAVVFLTAIIGVVFNSKAALATTSADSTFSQLIREIDCSHTVYSRAGMMRSATFLRQNTTIR